jgi:putative glycosyltransferase (TIGR04348 family)
MRIAIATPAAAGTRLGNRRTAQRWARLLRALGHRVDVVTDWDGRDHDAMIALHAKKSLPAQLAFKRRFPARPLLLALTGTDVYRDVHADANAAAALDRADRLIVLQEAALDELTPVQRRKARVIFQSELARGPWEPPHRTTRFCALGHLRAEKDPLLAAQALRRLEGRNLRLVQAGAALAPDFAAAARTLMRDEPRYRWLGDLPHGRALALLRRSHALIISSALEGGAHVVSEAIVHGVPVLASDIPGNRGLLGAGYAGYFPVGDDAALAALMDAAARDGAFLGGLAHALAARRPLFAPEREADAWRTLLHDVSAESGATRRAPALP